MERGAAEDDVPYAALGVDLATVDPIFLRPRSHLPVPGAGGPGEERMSETSCVLCVPGLRPRGRLAVS